MAEFTETITVNCPDCESEHVVKIGVRNGYQRYLCRDCEKKFRITGEAHHSQFHVEMIGAALDMYFSGMSYKQVAENLEKVYDIPEPSKRTIYDWVHDYAGAAAKRMKSYPAQVGDDWVADEMQLKVGGDRLWNWNVMDTKTRYILASHLSRNRGIRDAEQVMKKAARATNVKPKTITTDGLSGYTEGIQRVFPGVKHIVSQGIYEEVNNNLSERLQGSFRQRTKTMRGLETRETGQEYLDGWVVDYNLFKDHEAHKGGTPGEAANVNPPYHEWADVVRQERRPRPTLSPLALAVMGVVPSPHQKPTDKRVIKLQEYRGQGQKSRPRSHSQGSRGRGGHDFRMTGPKRKR